MCLGRSKFALPFFFFYNLCVDAHIEISTSKPWKQSVHIVTVAVILQNGIVVLVASNAINVDQSMRVCCKESFDSNLLARTFHACGCCNLQYCNNNTNNLFILPSRSSWKIQWNSFFWSRNHRQCQLCNAFTPNNSPNNIFLWRANVALSLFLGFFCRKAWRWVWIAYLS